MLRISEFIISFVANAAWQVPALFLLAYVGTYFLKNAPASYRFKIWIIALALGLAIPILSVTRVVPTTIPSFEGHETETSPLAQTHSSSTTVSDNLTSPNLNRTQNNHIRSVSTSANTVLLLAGVYTLFVLGSMIRLTRLWLRKEKLRRSVSSTVPENIQLIALRCREALGLQNVEVSRAEAARVPCTLGIHHPVIVLPDVFCRNVNEPTLLSVVGHEMAHVARKDSLSKLFCEVVALPISFHPVTLLLKKRIERERELACDELVTTLLVSPKTYARSLVTAADLSLSTSSQTFMLSIFDGPTLEERIMRLTTQQFRLSKRTGRTITTFAVMTMCLVALSLTGLSFELRTEAQTLIEQSFAKTIETIPPTATFTKPTTERSSVRVEQSQVTNDRSQKACDAGRKGDVSAIPVLISMLGDDTKTELTKCWANENWSPALDTFKHPSPGEQAALTLASMGRPAFQPLVEQLNSGNANVRRNAAWAIGELTNMSQRERASAVPQLNILLGDADEWVRMASARALGELRDRRATYHLSLLLSDGDWRVREMAAWSLSELKDDTAVKALGNALLSDSRLEVRRRAAEALGEIKSADGLPFLKQALNDPESLVNTKVAWAISEIEDSE